jgi:hypothetical protein
LDDPAVSVITASYGEVEDVSSVADNDKKMKLEDITEHVCSNCLVISGYEQFYRFHCGIASIICGNFLHVTA